MDAIDLRSARQRIAELLAAEAVDARVLAALRHEHGLVPQETELWDYKASLGTDSLSIGTALLHIVSFHNTYGGYLLYGVGSAAVGQAMQLSGVTSIPNQQQLRDSIRAYTGSSIPIVIGSASLSPDSPSIAIVCIPKRVLEQPPVTFGKNGPDDKPGKPLFLRDTAYFRDMDQSVPVRTRDQWALLFGRRRNPNLWGLDGESADSPTLDHTLPDQNVICPWFIGRSSQLIDLWQWLANPFAYLKLLAGDGGKGKSSLAYEFSKQVCTSAPLGFERVLWLSAKRQRFVGLLDGYVPMPDTHFNDTTSFLQRLADQCAITSTESQGASAVLLQTLIRDALRHIPSLIVVDDVDSLEVVEQKRLLSTIQQLSGDRARFLVTTRMNFAFAPDIAMTVRGLELDDYTKFTAKLAAQFSVTVRDSQIRLLHEATDGSPLFTESVLRLARQGMRLDDAVDHWKGRLGAEVRNAALMKEIRSLRAESRRVLLAYALLETASVSEVKNVVEYVEHTMRVCLAELQAMFLLAEPKFIDGEQRFAVSSNTQSLVLENAAELCNDPQGLERRAMQLLRLRRGTTKVRSVGLAISQAMALLKDERFVDAKATLRAALETEPNNADLLSQLGLCLLVEGQCLNDARRIEEARDEFRRSHKQGQRRAKTFELWHEAEVRLDHMVGAEEVCRLAIAAGAEPMTDWLKRRALAQVALADRHVRAAGSEQAIKKLREAADELATAGGMATESDRIGFERLQAEVHDRVWLLLRRKGSGIAELKLAADCMREFIERGDVRRDNIVRLVEILDLLLDVTRANRSRSKGFTNLVKLIAKQVETGAKRLREKGGKVSDLTSFGEVIAQRQHDLADLLKAKTATQ